LLENATCFMFAIHYWRFANCWHSQLCQLTFTPNRWILLNLYSLYVLTHSIKILILNSKTLSFFIVYQSRITIITLPLDDQLTFVIILNQVILKIVEITLTFGHLLFRMWRKQTYALCWSKLRFFITFVYKISNGSEERNARAFGD